MSRVSAGWLSLREPADAAARAADLLEHLPPAAGQVVHDLGCGTGAMGRWLAPRLAGPQHWVLHDRDADLLGAARLPDTVTAEARQSDVTTLRAEELAGATLVTASALLDLLTEDELVRLAAACAGARCPVLLTLSVVGAVELVPSDALDRRLAQAFDGHQRRVTPRGRLLGPDAVAVARAAFRRLGFAVLLRPSPWRLGPSESDLAAQWFIGWRDAACEQRPELTAATAAYARRRLAQARAGRLAVTVGHADLLALPPCGQSSRKRLESA